MDSQHSTTDWTTADDERELEEEYLSDESSFYGTPRTKSSLVALAKSYEAPSQSGRRHPARSKINMTLLAERKLSSVAKQAVRASTFWVPGTGKTNYRQLSESPVEFAYRIAPTSLRAAQYDWLWVHNPFLSRQKFTEIGEQDVESFKQRGQAVLTKLTETRAEFENSHPHKTPGVVTRMMKSTREDAEVEIHSIAAECGILSGKWLIFSPTNEIDQVWLKVVEGTVQGKLGTGAKVGPPANDVNSEEKGGAPKNGRSVVCVYTEDFRNQADVARVLTELRERRCITNKERALYKTDAMTHLGVYTNNEWKLSPTLYMAKDLKNIKIGKGELEKDIDDYVWTNLN